MTQFCKKCLPKQQFSSFEDLLRHTRTYHRKQVKENKQSTKKNRETGEREIGRMHSSYNPCILGQVKTACVRTVARP